MTDSVPPAHAPLPWHCATEISSIGGLPIVATDGRFICDMAVVPKAMPHADEINQEAKGNALFIVEAVNSYAADKALIEEMACALENFLLGQNSPFSMDMRLEFAQAAIQKARAP